MPVSSGTYKATIKELEPPDGYKMLEKSIEVKITFGQGDEDDDLSNPMIINDAVIENNDMARVSDYRKQYVQVIARNELAEPNEVDGPDEPINPEQPAEPGEAEQEENNVNPNGEIIDDAGKEEYNEISGDTVEDIIENGGKIIQDIPENGGTVKENNIGENVVTRELIDEGKQDISSKENNISNDKKNIKTGDNVMLYCIEMFIGIISLWVAGSYVYKKKKGSK